ncbi:MAG: hypothetical protein COX39_01330 [Candidatus Nealsonbacteria bacterium CG23_combo_of_CG06-09_8_20_14_all_40_13]|uniref:Uncharacterized protein n=1 Tax=Candidatus Nealsonbacteria bacterium CG23_combo_of_CG06-09_8_20_14_all_40_13 TaxID=1974724 RepID=A0A2G9YRE2_9BACT|nr:MAG: hypothetical protein COX39_01330 [Candidatus Nealsonbacteria bacterium CG23_combo_of_CG06-09_8_20_14_all_40_13]PIR71140.1 MAG: hypothetical protein COU44_01190 [Candidatus Nealsonbacteria bacterium CG10_big_fil_rev_8_21_14_0_10_40_24]
MDDVWKAQCSACTSTYSVRASSKKEAIAKIRKAHEEDHGQRLAWHCDTPFFNPDAVFNLTCPSSPLAPRGW